MPLSCALLGVFAIGHGLHCYGNTTRTRNVSEYMLVLALCAVIVDVVIIHFFSRNKDTRLLIITSANVDPCSEFFHSQIPSKLLARVCDRYFCVTSSALLHCTIKKIKIIAELLLLPSKLIYFTINKN